MNKPIAAGVMQKLFLLIRRSVARATMRMSRNETALPVTEHETPEATLGEADAPAYVFGCSPTAAGSISVIQDHGDEYPEL